MNILDFAKLFFDACEYELIRAKRRTEPIESMRKAFILTAYINDYGVHDIAKSINRNYRQTRYLLDKAADLFSVNDAEITRYMKKYERTLADVSGADSNVD